MTNGHCLCGATTFAFDGDPSWVGYCHCDSCRRACSAPLTLFVEVARDGFRWTGAAPAIFASSPGVTRRFCGTCGSQMSFEATRYPGVIHLYAALLDDPDAFIPTAHVHTAEALRFVHIDDALPQHPGFAPEHDT